MDLFFMSSLSLSLPLSLCQTSPSEVTPVVCSAGHGVRLVRHGTPGLPALRPQAAHQVRAGLPRPLVPRGRGGANIQVSDYSGICL